MELKSRFLSLLEKWKKVSPAIAGATFGLYCLGAGPAWAIDRVVLPLSRLSVEVDAKEWRAIQLRREDRAGGIEGFWIHRQNPHRTRMILSKTLESRPRGDAPTCTGSMKGPHLRKKINEWNCLTQTQPLKRGVAAAGTSGAPLFQWQASRVREVPIAARWKSLGIQKLWVESFAIEQSNEDRPQEMESWLKVMGKLP